jgi:hypothetical protein
MIAEGPHMNVRHLLLLPALIAAVALLAPRAVLAEDAPADAATEAKALIAQIDAAETAKDDGAMSELMKKVPAVYKQVTDSGLKGSMMKALGRTVRNAKFPGARKAALDAVVETGDGKEAWKTIQGGYPADDVEDPERFNVEFVKAVGALHPDAAIDRLLETFKKAKQLDLASEAVLALGNYKSSKRREYILLEITKAGKNMVPSRSASKNPSPETTARWGGVSPAIGKALDTLTGEKVGDPLEWFKRVDEAKKNLKSLFRD